MSENQTITKTENTWLLRIITGMLSFTSLVIVIFLNTIIKKLDDIAEFKTQTVKELAELEVWRQTFENTQRNLQSDYKNLVNNPDKLYALKPDEVVIKRKEK